MSKHKGKKVINKKKIIKKYKRPTRPPGLVGKKAPDFKLPDQDGKMRTLGDHKGKWVLLYFYPKDDTPGCTAEACAIRDQFQDFKKIKAVVLGVSKDSVKSHKKFAEAYRLPFRILSDTDKRVIVKYGVISRTSFLIDSRGIIVKIYENVKPEKHARGVLEDIKNFKSK